MLALVSLGDADTLNRSDAYYQDQRISVLYNGIHVIITVVLLVTCTRGQVLAMIHIVLMVRGHAYA